MQTYLELAKFVCFDLWPYLFGHQIKILKQNSGATVFVFYTNCRFLKRLACHMAAPPVQEGARNLEYEAYCAKVEVFDTFILSVIEGSLANLGADSPPPVVDRLKKEPAQNKPIHDFWF